MQWAWDGEDAKAEGGMDGGAPEITGVPGMLVRAGGNGEGGILPSALGGSGNTLCASSSRP